MVDSREKGKRGERWVANEFRSAIPELDIHRSVQSQSGVLGPDVDGVPYLWVEVKHGKTSNPRSALKQAIYDSRAKNDVRYPIAVIKDTSLKRKDRLPPFITMRLLDFIDIYKWMLYARSGTQTWGHLGGKNEGE